MKTKRVVSYLLLIIGLFIFGNKLINKRDKTIIENNKIAYTIEKEVNYNYKDIDYYNMILVIPKINLKKGIYEKDDSRNDISKNIMIHNKSDYPDIENGNVILIAHSGSGYLAFFKDLDKLDNDSLIELYYKHTKYIYKLDNHYDIDKTGIASITRDNNKKTITLITCSNKDKNKQVIYIGYLIDEVKY